MNVGFKTGPKTWAQAQSIIASRNVECVEIWYRYDREDEYESIIQLLQQRGIAFGLHYWGVVNDNILPSFCHDEPSQYEVGIRTVKQTIDAARRWGAHYVNIHPGSRVLTRLNNEFNRLAIASSKLTPEDRAYTLLEKAVSLLHHYAESKNVLFLVETVPARDATAWDSDTGRLSTLDVHHASIQMLVALARQGYFITNDLSHTAANQPNSDREIMWQDLYRSTMDLAPQTKLLHINTVREPFNGTDSHDGILPEDWQNGVFPDETQFKQLLALFKDRSDVWAIPEPREETTLENYLALQRYVASLAKDY